MVKNGDRRILKMLEEICAEEGIDLKLYCHDWIAELTRGGKSAFICGYQLEGTSAPAYLIAKDKSALYSVLSEKGIPAVEHRLFITPLEAGYLGKEGSWAKMLELLKRHKRLVVKDNEGTGGKNMHIVKNEAELEEAVLNLFTKVRTIALSPYLEIKNEYRVIISNGPKLVFYKERPFVTGDGKNNILSLMLEKYGRNLSDGIDLKEVPKKDERKVLCWQHNLAKGSEPKLLGDGELKEKVCGLAERAASALNIDLASVDVVDTDGGLKILEINSGIMMEKFSESRGFYSLAKEIYREIILKIF